MWSLTDYRNVFLAVGLIGVLILNVPIVLVFVPLPGGQRFSELWLLGPRHTTEDYPFDVRENVSYSVYLGVRNDLGSSAYYIVYVKFRNQTEPLPNSTAGMPSSLMPLYEYRAFLENGRSWEQLLNFSFSQLSVTDNRSLVGDLTLNGVSYDVSRPGVWDEENKGYFYELFMELWVYQVASDAFRFHNRFVGLWVNMTLAS